MARHTFLASYRVGGMTCPTGSISSFPLQLGLTATDTLYDTVSEPVAIDFQWGTRSTPPIFTAPQTAAQTDEVGSGNSNLSTIRFMNTSYTVSAVQIVNASHKPWILPVTSQQNNTEDMVITFSNITAPYQYITFVIPILRINAQIRPNYLVGLSDQNANGPFSLQSCFPTNARSRFAYYTVCMNGSSAKTPPQNMYVFVSTDGIQVNGTLMKTIMGISGNKNNFTNFVAPPSFRFSSTAKSILSVADFSSYVQTTNQLLNFARFKDFYPDIKAPSSDSPENKADAYKCVAVDPDSAIVNGQIQVDLSTGELLPDVLAKRDALRAAHNVTGGMEPGRFEKYMGTALGVILSLTFFSIVIWLILVNVVEAGSGTFIEGQSNWVTMLPSYLLPALIMGFVGFIVGAMLK
jgi:hypothetical protein